MATRPSPTRAGPVLASLPRPALPSPTTVAVVSDLLLAVEAGLPPSAYRLDAGGRPRGADTGGGAP